MLTRPQMREHAVRLYRENDQSDLENEIYAFAIWHLLSGAARDTLRALVSSGPLDDGSVPSKGGRDELLYFGLAHQVCVQGEQGYQAASYQGWQVLKAGEP